MSFESVILAHSPRLFLRFQETSGGTAVDDSGNGRDFTLMGTASFGAEGWVPSDSASGAAQVDGGASSGFIRNPTSVVNGLASWGIFLVIDGNTGRQTSVSTWLSYYSASSASDIRVALNASGSIVVTVRGTAAITSSLRPWRNQSILYIGWNNAAGAVKLYQDGILVAQGTAGAGLTMGNNGSFVIGQRQGSAGGTFSEPGHFKIDEIAVFGSDLSQDVVERISIAYSQIDATDPALDAASSAENNKVQVYFSKPVWGLSTAGNYAISGGVSVLTATPDPGLRSVLLTTSGMTAGTTYTLTASGILDADSSAPLTNDEVSFVAARLDGVLKEEAPLSGVLVSYDTSVVQSLPSRQYLMRAYYTANEIYVHWLVDDEPDFLATQAPVSAVLLEDIVVARELCAEA